MFASFFIVYFVYDFYNNNSQIVFVCELRSVLLVKMYYKNHKETCAYICLVAV